MNRQLKISDMIAPSFYGVHRDIKRGAHTHYWLKGGRGSGKSSFVSIEIILGMMQDEKANAVALRKTGVNLKDSVYGQLLWAIDMLGMSRLWETRQSPLELRYRPTGQRILFRGGDNTRKIKSTKFRKGYAKFIWYEEADEFGTMEEIRSINQSLMRGGKAFFVFYTYNPPKSKRSWVNEEVLRDRNDRLIHHSSFLGVPRQWLGEQFFVEARVLRETREEAYRHEYLGEVTGSGGEVFSNITLRQIKEEEILSFDRIARGIDWGFATDPFHYTVNHYDSTRRKLYIYYEIHKRSLSNLMAAQMVREENTGNGFIICDSAEPKSIAELSGYGLKVYGAKKGPDSVEYGIKWLQDLDEIIIDPARCPNTAREFSSYELESDTDGSWRAHFPDRDNHSIDAVRYSREMDMKRVTVR